MRSGNFWRCASAPALFQRCLRRTNTHCSLANWASKHAGENNRAPGVRGIAATDAAGRADARGRPRRLAVDLARLSARLLSRTRHAGAAHDRALWRAVELRRGGRDTVANLR